MAKVFDNNTINPDIGQIASLRGYADFGNLKQFNLFEGGNALLAVINAPYFLTANPETKALVNNFCIALESEFKGLDGLGNLETESSTISDGITELEMITKVTEPGSTTITINTTEKVGRLYTKTQEAFLRGLRDPKSQVKTYNGLLTTENTSTLRPNFQYEVFNLLYFVMDNSWREIELAYIFLNAQLTTTNLSDIANVTRGDNSFKEIPIEFKCLPIRGNIVNKLAKDYLNAIRDHLNLDSYNFNWSMASGNVETNGKVAKINQIAVPTIKDGGDINANENRLSVTTGVQQVKDY